VRVDSPEHGVVHELVVRQVDHGEDRDAGVGPVGGAYGESVDADLGRHGCEEVGIRDATSS